MEKKSQHVKCHVILENLNEYDYQGLDPEAKVHHHLNGIKCDKMLEAVVATEVNHNKYELDFDTHVAYFFKCVEKRGPATCFKGASVA